jgi:hypothetical protein
MLLQKTRVLNVYACHQDSIFMLKESAGDFQDLFRRFTCPEDHFGEAFAQSAVRIDLREAKVGHRGSLETSQQLFTADAACAKLFEEPDGFRGRHGVKMGEKEAKSKRLWG